MRRQFGRTEVLAGERRGGIKGGCNTKAASRRLRPRVEHLPKPLASRPEFFRMGAKPPVIRASGDAAIFPCRNGAEPLTGGEGRALTSCQGMARYAGCLVKQGGQG